MRTVVPLSVVALVGFYSVALADTRSDVLERLARCNVLSDGRSWLDCYYAAAQPERSELGLPPAPQEPAFKSLFDHPLPAGSAGLTTPEGAGTESESTGFFGMFGADKVPPEQFGLTNAKPGHGVNVDRIVEKLSSYTFANGKFTVTLANGQVWQQTGGPRANWRSTPGNYTATVTFGSLRTFNLRVQDGPNLDDTIYKVERIH